MMYGSASLYGLKHCSKYNEIYQNTICRSRFEVSYAISSCWNLDQLMSDCAYNQHTRYASCYASLRAFQFTLHILSMPQINKL